LNKDDAVCARNIEIFGIVDEGPLLMLVMDLKLSWWDVNSVHHRAIHNRSDVFADPRGFPFKNEIAQVAWMSPPSAITGAAA